MFISSLEGVYCLVCVTNNSLRLSASTPSQLHFVQTEVTVKLQEYPLRRHNRGKDQTTVKSLVLAGSRHIFLCPYKKIKENSTQRNQRSKEAEYFIGFIILPGKGKVRQAPSMVRK